MRMLFCTLWLTATLLATGAYAAHQDIDQPPPAEPVYEVTPGERPGYYYAPGYWRWDGKRHIWTPSRWIVDRPGYSWVPDGWEKHGTKWHFAKGYWIDPATGEEYEEAVTASTSYDKPDAAPSDTAAKSKTKKPAKRIRKPDYSNKRIWPRVVHH